MVLRHTLLCFLWLVLASYGGSVDDAPVQDVIEKLAMDIEWVYQGNKFEFTGFFCEILGMSSGFRSYFPEMRVSKSHYDDSMHEGPLGAKSDMKSTRTFFDKELMQKEALDIEWLMSPSRELVQEETETEAGVAVLEKEKKGGGKEEEEDCMESAIVEKYTVYNGGDLARSYAPQAHTSPSSCCEACRAQPLCVAWSIGPHYLGEYAPYLGGAGRNLNKCQLKGMHPPALQVPETETETAVHEAQTDINGDSTNTNTQKQKRKSADNVKDKNKNKNKKTLPTPNAVSRSYGTAGFVSGRMKRRSAPRAIVFHGTLRGCVDVE